MKRRFRIYRSVITIMMAAVLAMSSGLIYVQAYSVSGLDEFIALDMLGSGAAETDTGNADEVIDSEPLLGPSQFSFAQALAQKFRPQEGTFTLSEESRFFIVSEEKPSEELQDTVGLMASQFAGYGIPSDDPLPVVYGAETNIKSGDIVIRLLSEEDFLYGIETADLEETYRLDIFDTASIEACDEDGIWYGLIELMEIARERQLLTETQAAEEADKASAADTAEEDAPANALVLGRLQIRDGPDLKERTFMLDCGRKYYSKTWIENLIKRASLQRYNAIVLHFAEAEGIRLDSEVFPWLTDGIESLTTDEMKEIVETAHRYHMDVIPSFDTPGHNTFMVRSYAKYVKKHLDFSFDYDGKTYDVKTKDFKSIANHYSYGGETRSADYIGVDLTREHAVAFTNALIEGYADFFRQLGCNKFDIGSDEMLGWYTFDIGGKTFTYDNRWSALDHWKKYARKTLGISKGSAKDVLISYINSLAERLEHKGYTCRVFNDEIDSGKGQHVKLRESIEITYWFDVDNTAAHYADEGHVVHNFMESWCFYVLRKHDGKDIMKNKYKTVNPRNIFENWNPRSFARKAGKSDTVPPDKLGGAYFAVWCDHPDYKSAEKVWKETELRTWASASRMWNAEVNSEKSGILAAPAYEDMKSFALGMGSFPGYTGDSEAAPVLRSAPSAVEVKTWWQELKDSL